MLGLGVCRGLMEEFRLFRTAFGAPELGREWGAVAPRKPEEQGKRQRKNGGNGKRIDQRCTCQGSETFFKLITRYAKALRK